MEKEKIDAEVTSLVEQARAFTVTTHEQATGASSFLSAIKTLQKQVRDTFGPLKQAASDAHKRIVAEEKRHLDPLDRSEAEIKRRIGDFMESERRKREAAERAAREEAARIERQRRAEEEAARKAAEEERLKEAARLEAEGKAKEAEKVLDAPLPPVARPAPPPAVVLPPPPRRVEGVVTRETYRANVYSIAELAGYVAANPEKAHLLQPNIPELNKMARLVRQGGAQVVPGVACVADQEVVSR